ncbi:MAG: sulfotransferase [Deltaproteobacteria bacterium]|nr:sulfotransferase [Deltaproteobacteria bacterium]
MIGTYNKKVINRVTQRLSPVVAKLSLEFSQKQLKEPFFLIGSGRSGTTLLAGLLGMHRDVANWAEANEILDPQWYPWRPSNQHLLPMELDPVAFTQRWWNDAQQRQDEIRAIFGAYQWLQQKPYFLNKSPFNTFRIPYLLEIFPTARFIHLTRDGRAVAFSYARKLQAENKLGEWPEPQRTAFRESFDDLIMWLSAFWKENVEEVAQQNAALRLTENGVMLDLTYEELCLDPTGTLNRICHFIGIDPKRFVSTIENVQIEKQNNKWKERLESDLVAQMTTAMEPLLSQKNYS